MESWNYLSSHSQNSVPGVNHIYEFCDSAILYKVTNSFILLLTRKLLIFCPLCCPVTFILHIQPVLDHFLTPLNIYRLKTSHFRTPPKIPQLLALILHITIGWKRNHVKSGHRDFQDYFSAKPHMFLKCLHFIWIGTVSETLELLPYTLFLILFKIPVARCPYCL